MSTLRGKQLVMTGAFQDDFETAASEGAVQLPYYDESFQPGEALEQDPEIREGLNNERDATDPAPTLPAPTGNMTVALDVNLMLFWMKLIFGEPDTSGLLAPFTHVFTSGNPVLPSATLEVPMGEERWKAMVGAKVNTFGFNFDKETGFKRVQLGCVARSVQQLTGAAASLFDGETPAVWARAKAPGTIFTFAINGVTVGRCVGGGYQYNNNLSPEYFADGSRFPSDYEPGDAVIELTPRIRLDRLAANNGVLDVFQGQAGSPFACSVTASMGAGQSLTLTHPRCFGELISPVVAGPGAVEFQGRIIAAQGAGAPALTATLINAIEEV